MRFKGGTLNGTIACLYGFVSLWLLFFHEGMSYHRTMQKICYVLALTGFVIALYWLFSREVSGIPMVMLGLNFLGLARYAEHIPMDIAAAALSVTAMLMGLMMYARPGGAGSAPPG